mgnify:CR=1 FL=1
MENKEFVKITYTVSVPVENFESTFTALKSAYDDNSGVKDFSTGFMDGGEIEIIDFEAPGLTEEDRAEILTVLNAKDNNAE